MYLRVLLTYHRRNHPHWSILRLAAARTPLFGPAPLSGCLFCRGLMPSRLDTGGTYNVPRMSAPTTNAEPGGSGSGFPGLLGLSLDDVGPDGVTMTLEVHSALHQPYGIVHGGVWCSVVETAASIATAAWYGDRGRVVGVSNHTDFIRAISEGRTTAVASPIHRGRLQQLWLVEIRTDDGRMVARGEVRIQNLPADGGGN